MKLFEFLAHSNRYTSLPNFFIAQWRSHNEVEEDMAPLETSCPGGCSPGTVLYINFQRLENKRKEQSDLR